jgi:hypothetical protein
MRLFILFFTIMFLAIVGRTQNIAGRVLDVEGKPLSNVTLTLKKQKDSTVVQIALSDGTGRFVFQRSVNEPSFVTATFIGYQLASQVVNTGKPLVFNLLKAVTKGEQASVKAQKPAIEVRAGKIIVGVENTANAIGQSAL